MPRASVGWTRALALTMAAQVGTAIKPVTVPGAVKPAPHVLRGRDAVAELFERRTTPEPWVDARSLQVRARSDAWLLRATTALTTVPAHGHARCTRTTLPTTATRAGVAQSHGRVEDGERLGVQGGVPLPRHPARALGRSHGCSRKEGGVPPRVRGVGRVRRGRAAAASCGGQSEGGRRAADDEEGRDRGAHGGACGGRGPASRHGAGVGGGGCGVRGSCQAARGRGRGRGRG
mmetsp:Transcript_18066/g.47561  ORF Transcript_18066/g.47561 Transcript_18066/m.47561 type:complete len:233 (+) Transcript_18066:86-784(+)